MKNTISIIELFHFLFLEHLLRIATPSFLVLKGGVNLRFFFQSPRYSEDLDIDAIGGRIETLEKNVYKVLKNAQFLRTLATFGIEGVETGDPHRAKQTETTQRFKIHLITEAGETLATKIGFSRRKEKQKLPFVTERVHPEFARRYQRLPYSCQHYTASSAAIQKDEALVGRNATQARDLFDLYLLQISGHLNPQEIVQSIPMELRKKALFRIEELEFNHYRGQVVEFLEAKASTEYNSRQSWKTIIHTIQKFLSS